MCVLALAWQAHPRWRLVVAANRNEFHDRPSEPLHRWPEPAIIAGRDRHAGGTWLAVAERGLFSVVTNLRGYGERQADRASRGKLVVALATGNAGEATSPDSYNPFNAVSIVGGKAMVLSNRPSSSRRVLQPGLHAMSNGPLDLPWPKTERLKTALARWLDEPDPPIVGLFASLRDPDPPANGVSGPAAIFVRDPVYGTRCGTLVLVDRHGAGSIRERRYDAQGEVTGETAIGFSWS